MKNAFDVLKSSPLTEKLFSRPPRVIFKRPPNLKDILVKPKFHSIKDKPKNSNCCKPCNKPRCGICQIITDTSSFKSSSTDRVYPIVGGSTCESSNVIYQLSCKHCPKDYIGQTSNPLRVRMTNHRFSVVHDDNTKPVSQHATLHNENFENCYSLTALHKIKLNHTLM